MIKHPAALFLDDPDWGDPLKQAIILDGLDASEGPARANPYPKGSVGHRLWCIGWAGVPARGRLGPSGHAKRRADVDYDGDYFERG